MCGGEVVPCNEATQQAVGYVFLSSVMIRVASLICQEPMSVVLSFVEHYSQCGVPVHGQRSIMLGII